MNYFWFPCLLVSSEGGRGDWGDAPDHEGGGPVVGEGGERVQVKLGLGLRRRLGQVQERHRSLGAPLLYG